MPDLRHVDLNLLLTLEVLVRERNVTRAAAALGLSQPAMSHRLARLREYFEDPLLVVGSTGLQLTARAEALQGPIHRGLRELEAALVGTPDFDPATSTRHFEVASSDFAEFVVMPPLLARIRDQAPGVRLSLRRPGPGLASDLESGRLDMAVIGGGLPESAGLRRRRVLSGAFASTVRADHPAVGKRLDLETFLALPHLLISPSGEGPGIVDVVLERMGRQRQVVLRVPSFTAAPFVAARSDLILTAPRGIILEAAKLVPLRVFQPPLDLPVDDAMMVWHERWQDDPGHRWIREINIAVMDALEGQLGAGRPGQALTAAPASKPKTTPKPSKPKPSKRGG